MTTAVCDLYGDSMAACAHDDGVREARQAQVREGGKPGPASKRAAYTLDGGPGHVVVRRVKELENKSRKRERLKRWVSRVWEGGD